MDFIMPVTIAFLLTSVPASGRSKCLNQNLSTYFFVRMVVVVQRYQASLRQEYINSILRPGILLKFA